MRGRLIPIILLLGLIASCAGQSSVKPVELLDERTGVTVGALEDPVELLPDAPGSVLIPGNRPTFAYLGPVEWNRSGTLRYGLWVHIAPGKGEQPGDIRAPNALTLKLDDGTLALSPIEAPKLGREPYREAVSWGQTAYFDLTPETLRRIAASSKLELDIHAVNGSPLSFHPTVDTHAALTRYLQARGITGD
jgi:hypothetical protein